MSTPPRWGTAFIALAAFGFLLGGAALVPVPMLYFYDDGVYYLSAVRTAAGERPYADFYLAHPPGLVWLGAGLVRAGGGIMACRAAAWLLAVLFAGMLAAFLVRLQGASLSARPAAWLAVLFLAATQMFLDASSQVLTQLPGMALTLAGFFLLLPGRLRPGLAGLLLAAATMFRIQAAFIGPAWVVFILATYGWHAGRVPILRLTLTAMFAALALHGALALIFSNYLDCILKYHVLRAATPLGKKIEIVKSLFSEPQVAVGFIAAAVLAVSSRGPIRGLGAFAVAETLLTFFASRFLGEGYFLATYPYLFGSAAIVVAREAERQGHWRPIAAASIIVIAIMGPSIARVTAYRYRTQLPFERDLIARVQAHPGRTVACTPGKIPLFAGKELVADWNCPDTNSPANRSVGAWFVAISRRADLIVLTDMAIVQMSSEQCREIAALGKPIIFGTPAEEAEFRRRLAESQ